MTGNLSRRDFLGTSSVGGAALALGLSSQAAVGKEDEVVLGFIGTGGRGRFLLKQAVNLPGMRFGAICDLKKDALDKAMEILQEQRGKPKTYTDFRKMIETEKLDGIMIATEVGNHAKVAVPVLEAGYHIFCEKPLDADVERVDKFVKAARAAKGITQIGFQRRYKPGYVEAIQKVHAGMVGDVRYLQGHWQWPRLPGGGWVSDVKNVTSSVTPLCASNRRMSSSKHVSGNHWVMPIRKETKALSNVCVIRLLPGSTRMRRLPRRVNRTVLRQQLA